MNDICEWEAIFDRPFHVAQGLESEEWVLIHPGDKFSGTEEEIHIRKHGAKVDYLVSGEQTNKYFKMTRNVC